MRLGRPSSGQLDQWQPRLWIVLLALLAILGYLIAFVIKNDNRIEIDFVFFSSTVSLIWEIVLMLGIGVLGGVLLSQLYRRRRNQARQAPDRLG